MNPACRFISIAALTILLGHSGSSNAAESPRTPLADQIRGGWVADIDGIRHIFVLKVRGMEVSGIYCTRDCSDPANLAFVEKGAMTQDGVRFRLLKSDVTGRIEGDSLSLSIASSQRSKLPAQLALGRDPRKPAARTVEALFKSRGVDSDTLVIAGSQTPYVAPGPNELLTPAIVEGLWVWNNGPGRQHFIFQRAGKQLLGVVCGPCDNPYTFGVLDNVQIRGDTLSFNIVHEDWGIGIEYGPYDNHATATLARHELHLLTTQQNGPKTIKGDLVLTGPLRMNTTLGN